MKMQTMYFAKDMRVISNKYRKGYDLAFSKGDFDGYEKKKDGRKIIKASDLLKKVNR